MTQELQNGEHTQEWPAADRPFSADDLDAPVSMDDEPELSAAEEAAADAAEDAQSAIDNGELPDDTANDISGEENVNIQNGGARDIDATNVSITQGGARDVDATTVTVNQGGIGRVQADDVTVTQGGIGIARAEQLTLQEGGSAFAIMTDKATLDPESSVFLLIAGSTTGDVRPVLDWRAALAVGAGFAVVLSALRRLLR